jgi:exodeoxyribonuclease VII large subunit
MVEIQASTVSEVVFSIKKTLEHEYSDVTITGEISNLSYSSAGHYYFTLSDQNSSISCALFKMDAFRNPAIRKIKNGDKVLLRGPVSLYAKRGTFQVICKKIIPYGKGDLKAQFEFLKEKLRSAGYFDEENKIEIPTYPKKVAVITALRGAALQDFLNVMKRRCLWYDICIIPSIVQGDSCPNSIIKAIQKAEDMDGVDTIVITRGGGSMEDLWGFNDENLVKKVFSCEIPVISAIGHQVDYSLLDFVSDLRCETPSAAAEILSQPQTELDTRLRLCARELKTLFMEFRENLINRLEKVNPMQFLYALQNKFRRFEIQLERLKFFKSSDLVKINENQQYIDELIGSCEKQINDKIETKKTRLNHLEHLLSSLDPSNVLNRGYSYLQTKSGNVIASANEFDTISESEVLKIQFSDGQGQVKRWVK